jgi:hypothetical protein
VYPEKLRVIFKVPVDPLELGRTREKRKAFINSIEPFTRLRGGIDSSKISPRDIDLALEKRFGRLTVMLVLLFVITRLPV